MRLAHSKRTTLRINCVLFLKSTSALTSVRNNEYHKIPWNGSSHSNNFFNQVILDFFQFKKETITLSQLYVLPDIRQPKLLIFYKKTCVNSKWIFMKLLIFSCYWLLDLIVSISFYFIFFKMLIFAKWIQIYTCRDMHNK